MSGYRARTLLGTLMMLAGFGLFSYGLVEVLHVGTCASGGPYVSARQCPGGTGWLIGALFGGIMISLIGAVIFMLRGTRPGRDGKSMSDHLSWGVLLFGLFFLATGLVAIYGAFGPGSNDAPGAKLGAAIVGGIFIPMGLIPIVFELRSARSDAKEGKPVGSGPLGEVIAPASSQGFSEQGLHKLAQMQAASRASAASATPSQPPPSAPPTLTSSGTATINSFKYLGQSGAGETLVEFDLAVVAGGNPVPYELVHRQMVPLDQTDVLATGATLRVRVSRENPAELTIDW